MPSLPQEGGKWASLPILQAMSVFRIHDIKTLEVSPFIDFLCWGQHECLLSHCFYFSDSCVYLFFKVIPGSSPLDLSTELPYQCTMKRKVRKKKKKGVITANVAGTKFEIGECVSPEASTSHDQRESCVGIGNNVELGEVIIFYVMDF